MKTSYELWNDGGTRLIASFASLEEAAVEALRKAETTQDDLHIKCVRTHCEIVMTVFGKRD